MRPRRGHVQGQTVCPVCRPVCVRSTGGIHETREEHQIELEGAGVYGFHACGGERDTPGNDHLNWDCIAKALKAVKYNRGVVIESFTKDVKIIARAAAIWRQIEPSREEIATKGLRFLKKTLR